MRYAGLVLAVISGFWALPALAQETGSRPLYNSSGNAGSTLYNSNQNGTGTGKPLSLRQIMQGTNTSGYEYSREGTRFPPYGTQNMYSSGSISPSVEEVAAYRARQAQDAQRREAAAQTSLISSYADPLTGQVPANTAPAQTQMYMDQFQNPGSPTPGTATAPRQIYKGRDLGITEPKKVFNTP